MPKQVLPVNQLDQVGLILDSPPVSLPPQAFSDARNVRFRDGAVRKMEGEVNLFPDIISPEYFGGLATNDSDQIKYVAWWANPNLADNQQGYYLVIVEDNVIDSDVAYLVKPGGTQLVEKGRFSVAPGNQWQHTFFQGGFALIVNNGVDAPRYILDIDGNEDEVAVPNFLPLPGWESYFVNEEVIEDTFTANSSRLFDLNRAVDFSRETITVQDVTDASHIIDYSVVTAQSNFVDSDGNVGVGQVGRAPASDDAVALLPGRVDSEQFIVFTTTDATYSPSAFITVGIGLLDDQVGRRYRISVRSRIQVAVTAGVVRAFGDFLVAGNLTEIDRAEPIFNPDGSVNTDRIIRNLPGVVRTSDVAAPGQVPTNWNPFAAGVSTADEYIISDTGIVQDMVELQGNMYLYSSTSISVLRRSGNAQVPFTVASVTGAYGVQTTGAVTEFDGKHFVVGSQDVYLFGGHPGSIQSIADKRVRRYLFDDLNPLHEQNMFVLRYQQKDEIWICYPSTASTRGEIDKALIWNYRQNNWTLRDLRNVVSGDVGPVPGGGIPGATVILSGDSGNNGIDALGVDEVQTLVIDSEFAVPNSTQPGLNHLGEITIDNADNLVSNFTAPGPIFYDVVIGPNFNSGTGSDARTPLAFRFQLFEADNTFATGFPFDVVLDSDVTSAQAVRTALETDSDFNRYYRIISTDSEDNFVIRTRALPGELYFVGGVAFTYPDYATGGSNIAVEGIIQATPDTIAALTRDSECDIIAPANGQFTVAGTERSYQFGASINTNCVNRLYFPEVLRGTNIDSDRLSLEVSPAAPGSVTEMYEPDGILSTDLMYGTGRGGEVARPNRNPGSGNSEINSQDMYQDAFPATQAVTLPWIPDRAGAHSFRVNVPGADGSNQPVYVGEDIRLTAYEVPPTPAANADITTNARSSNPTFTGTPRTYSFDTGQYVYSPTLHMWERQQDHTITTTFYGDMRVAAGNTRVREIALYIRDAINDQAPDSWIASATDSDIVNMVSVQQRWQYVENEAYSDSAQANRFMYRDLRYGYRATTAATAHRPRFTIAGPDFTTTTVELAVDSEQQAWEVLDELVNTIRAHGQWIEPNNPVLMDSDGEPWRVVENNQNIPIDSAWSITLVSVGNLALTIDPNDVGIGLGLTYFNPRIFNSRNLRPANAVLNDVFDVNGTPVTVGVGDSRGSSFTRATPSLMAIRIRNTSVPTGQELILLSGYDGCDYDPTTNPGGDNSSRLTSAQILSGVAEDALAIGSLPHMGWIDTIRLANRRLDIQYEVGTSQFRIVPVNYDDLASFALEIVFNDTQANADRIQTLFDMTQGANNLLDLNPYSIQVLPQGTGNSTLGIATVAGAIDSIPDERPSPLNAASLQNIGPTPSVFFDVDRPWETIQINPNKEYPIFASVTELDRLPEGSTDQAQTTSYVNKIIGADIGWSYPIFSVTETRNDDSEAYESYVERKQLALQPEFETEHIASVAILADGSYTPSLDSTPLRNRLELRMTGTDYPGEDVSLVRADSEQYVRNAYAISEDYKTDMRVHGRLMNARLTDDVTEANPNADKFNSRTEWNVSGLQIEFGVDGRR